MSATEETPVPVVADDAPVEQQETPAPAAAADEAKDKSTPTGEKRPAEDEAAEGESDAKK